MRPEVISSPNFMYVFNKHIYSSSVPGIVLRTLQIMTHLILKTALLLSSPCLFYRFRNWKRQFKQLGQDRSDLWNPFSHLWSPYLQLTLRWTSALTLSSTSQQPLIWLPCFELSIANSFSTLRPRWPFRSINLVHTFLVNILLLVPLCL